MADYSLAVTGLQLPDPNAYASVLGQAAKIQQAQTTNSLAQLRLRQANEQQGALQAFNRTKDMNVLGAHPELLQQVIQNQSGLANLEGAKDARNRELNARAAQRVLDTRDDLRAQVHAEEVQKGVQEGRIPALMGQRLLATGPDERMLKGIIHQAMPLAATETEKFQVVDETTDRYGNKRSIHGFVDPVGRRVTPYNPPGTDNSVSTHDALQGKELLNALDPGERANIQAYLEGRRAPPPANPRVPATMRAWDILGRVDPSFDMTKWKTRNETEAAYAKGPEGRNITALNTLPRHLEELQEAAKDLRNLNVPGGTIARYLTNPVASAMSPRAEAALKRFYNSRQAVAEELGKAFHGSPSVTATEGWKHNFDATSSDQALQAGIVEAVKLATGRNDELEASYTRAMGKPPSQPFVSQSARDAFDKIMARAKGEKITPKVDNGPLPSGMSPPSAITEGTRAVNPKTGQRIIFKGGQWQPLE